MSLTACSWFGSLSSRVVVGEWRQLESSTVREATDEFREQRQQIDANLIQLSQLISQSKHHNDELTSNVKHVSSIFDGLLDSIDWELLESRALSLHAAADDHIDNQPNAEYSAYDLYFAISESISLLDPIVQTTNRASVSKHPRHVQLVHVFNILEKSQRKLTRQSSIPLEPVRVFMQHSANHHTFLVNISETMKQCHHHDDESEEFSPLIDEIMDAINKDHVRLQRLMGLFKSTNHFQQFLHALYILPFLKLIDTSVHQSINRLNSRSLLIELRHRLVDWTEIHARFASNSETLFGFQPVQTARFMVIINQVDCKRISEALADEIAQGMVRLLNDQHIDWSSTTIIENKAISACEVFSSSFELMCLIESIVTILVSCENINMSVEALRMLAELTEMHSQILTTTSYDASQLRRYIAPSYTSNLHHLLTSLSSLATIQKTVAINMSRLGACSEPKPSGVLSNISVHIGASIATDIGSTLDSMCHLIDRSVNRIIALIDTTDWSQKRDLPLMLRPKVTTVSAAIANVHLFIDSVVEKCTRIVGGHGLMHRLLLLTLLTTSMSLMEMFHRLCPSRYHFAQYMLDLKATFAVTRHWRNYLHQSLLRSPSQLTDGNRVIAVDRACSEFGIAVALLDTSPKLLGPRLSALDRALERTSSHSITSDTLHKSLDSLGGQVNPGCPLEMPLTAESVLNLDCVSLITPSCVVAALPSSQITSTGSDDLNSIRMRLSRWMFKRYDQQEDDFPALSEQEQTQANMIKDIANNFAMSQ